jgi:lipoprotein-anchoring transpeptidase ErfK/SrfK
LFIVILKAPVTIRFRFAARPAIHHVRRGSIHRLLKPLARQHSRALQNRRARVVEWRVMRRALCFGLVAFGLSVSGAKAQSYGGGFIELLMTGRDPSRYVRPVRQNPAYGVPPYAAGPGLYGRARVAALPNAPYGEERGIGRIMDPKYRRQTVDYDGPHGAGTIVIDTPAKFLYLVQPGGKALRYGIGVGRPGFQWAGVKSVSLKREWPDWRPPPEMLKRRPDLPRHMAGGPGNPLGARALYLGSSLYRVHGTNEPHTIGQAVSSGCIRMLNEDVIELYNRVKVGAKVIVI